jgi:hypothetical protein
VLGQADQPDPGPGGAVHDHELRRGVPRMSPALLSKRLRTLTRAGVVERRDDGPRWLGQGSFATVPRLAGQAAPVRAAVTATVV